MGAYNYKTNDYITLAIHPYSHWELGQDLEQDDKEFAKKSEKLKEEYISDLIDEYYRCDELNAKEILKNYSFSFFSPKLECGYYEGLQLVFDTDFDFYRSEDKKEAIKEATLLGKMLKDLVDVGFCVCYPGWCTKYLDYNTSILKIKEAVRAIKKDIRQTETDWSYCHRRKTA